MPSLDVDNDFLAHRSVPGVRFEHNDYVQVTSGPYTGERGSLVCLLTLGIDPCFVLESESGQDLEVLQSQLKLVEA
jgi:hypothetical protein